MLEYLRSRQADGRRKGRVNKVAPGRGSPKGGRWGGRRRGRDEGRGRIEGSWGWVPKF